MRKIEFTMPIYTYQIDFVGHVNNAVYIQWMEIGRQKLLESVGLAVEDMVESGIAPILVSTEIVYKVPLLLGDQVRVEIWLSELRKASARLEYRFYKGDVLAASGSQRGLFVNLETMKPCRFTPDMRSRLEAYYEECQQQW